MPASLAPKMRFDALDTLRCLAVLFMVQGHIFTLVLEDAARQASWYRWHSYLHGFTGPAFLFGAGLAFGVTTLHDLEPHLRWGVALRRRLYRYASLLAIGYAFQLPPLGSNVELTRRHLESFARVEALQHIGVAMLVCQALVLALRSRTRVVAASAALGTTLALLGPWLSRQPLEQSLPLGVAAYLTSSVGSTFPLVPWSGFLLLGVAGGGLFSRRTLFEPARGLCRGLPLLGLGLVGTSLLLDRAAPDLFGDHSYWKVSPYFFLRRLGWLLVLLGGFALADRGLRRWRKGANAGVLRRWVRLVSQSSLVIYVAHLLLLFGSPLHAGYKPYAHGLNVLQASLLALATIAALLWLAAVWTRAERSRSVPFARLRKASVVAVGTVVLFACASGMRPAPRSPVTPAAQDAAVPPRLLLAVVVDQLGSDSLLRYAPLLPEDGALRMLLERGRVWEHVVYPYATTFTAPGHAMLYSGATPARSGISTNYVIDPQSGRARAVVDDGESEVLGQAGANAGPAALLVPTVADALKRQTGGRGRVVSLSLKDRAAVLPAGKRPDLVLWYSSQAQGFTTSRYYAEALPPWLLAYSAAHPIDARFERWEAAEPRRLQSVLGPDEAPGEGDYKGIGRSFPHAIADSTDPYAAWALAPASSEYLLELAFEAAQQMGLGEDAVPDLLAVSISGPDYAGHVFGPHSWEYVDHLRRADRALLELIRKLQAKTRLAVLITSDHGTAPLPERAAAALENDNEPGRAQPLRLDPAALTAALDAAVDAAHGEGDWVAGYAVPYVFLSPAARSHAQAPAIRTIVLQTLRAQPGVAAAYDTRELEALNDDDPLQRAARESVHPASAGDFFVALERFSVPDLGITPGHGTTHGSHHDYDTHVPVLVLSPGSVPQRTAEPKDVGRVAATLAALLGIKPPAEARQPPLPL